MRLGILKAGAPPRALAEFGSYPEMFRALLGEQFTYAVHDVEVGDFPAAPDGCAAWLVTGSPRGAYDPLPWVAELKDFLRAVKGRAALVGICFGHQVMAEAFGGQVVKSPKGWGLGAHSYAVAHAEPWMDGAADFTLAASHQDQVVALPPGAEVIAGNAFAPMGMLAWRDQRAMSLQLHPEFAADYAAALVEQQRGRGISDAEADRAMASLDAPLDRERVGGWIARFVQANLS